MGNQLSNHHYRLLNSHYRLPNYHYRLQDTGYILQNAIKDCSRADITAQCEWHHSTVRMTSQQCADITAVCWHHSTVCWHHSTMWMTFPSLMPLLQNAIKDCSRADITAHCEWHHSTVWMASQHSVLTSQHSVLTSQRNVNDIPISDAITSIPSLPHYFPAYSSHMILFTNLIFSASYSACSSLKMCRTKNCCRFSLA